MLVLEDMLGGGGLDGDCRRRRAHWRLNSNVAAETRQKRWSQRDPPTARDRTTSPRGLEHASTACWTDKVGGGEGREVEDG